MLGVKRKSRLGIKIKKNPDENFVAQMVKSIEQSVVFFRKCSTTAVMEQGSYLVMANAGGAVSFETLKKHNVYRLKDLYVSRTEMPRQSRLFFDYLH